METGAFYIGGVPAPELSELESLRLSGRKAHLIDRLIRSKVVRWCGMQASDYYAQGIINGLVDKTSMGTATPNRCSVLNSGMDQSKGDCADSKCPHR